MMAVVCEPATIKIPASRLTSRFVRGVESFSASARMVEKTLAAWPSYPLAFGNDRVICLNSLWILGRGRHLQYLRSRGSVLSAAHEENRLEDVDACVFLYIYYILTEENV